MNRPSPSESATLFKIGTTKIGNDGNQWIVASTNNGVHKWQKVNNNKINLTIITKMKKFGSFNVTNKVCVGDVNCFTLDLKKGIYDAYTINGDTLLIVHSSVGNMNKSNVKKVNWTKHKKSIGVDSGRFGFYDYDIIKELNKLDKQSATSVPFIEHVDNHFIVNTKMVIFNGKQGYLDYTESNKKLPTHLINSKFGAINDTGVGDGWYDVYTASNDRALLMGGFTHEKIFGIVEPKYNIKKTPKNGSKKGSKKSIKKSIKKGSKKGSKKSIKKGSKN